MRYAAPRPELLLPTPTAEAPPRRQRIWDRILLRREHRLLLDTALLGVAGAFSAQAFEYLLTLCQRLFLGRIAGYNLAALDTAGTLHHPHLGGHVSWLVPLSTTLGGLLAGFVVYTFAPEAEGHGTDTAVNAFHRLRGVIRARVPLVKMVASALTIGSGGSAGREGPTALITSGIASTYAVQRRYPERDRRVLLLVGMASGLAAIFRSPIGTAIFAVEVLYGQAEFESGVLVYTMLGSIVAYAVNGLFVGFRPLFHVPAALAPPTGGGFAWYIVLGLASGIAATIVPECLYRIRDLFRRIPCKPHFKPALGGLGVGLLALAFPQILGGGYFWMQAAIDGALTGSTMLALSGVKLLAFALTIGSGGSGGVFAPTLFSGAMLGGALALALHQSVAAFAVVGMAAVFGGAARVPIATILMVTEMTGGYQFLVPASLAVILSYLVQTTLSETLRYRSLYQAQVPTRTDSPAHYADVIRIARDLVSRHVVDEKLDL
jgi:CIC family chloride channel protein